LLGTKFREFVSLGEVGPSQRATDEEAFRAYAEELQPEAERYGLQLDARPVTDDDDHWQDKLSLLLADPVPVVSLTFGLPSSRDITALRHAGSRLLATVTTPAEARTAADAGVDGLVVQGTAAGGHSATYDPQRPLSPVATLDLVREVRAAVALPVIAAGGVADSAGARELLRAGAEAVAIGTLLLRADESGASQTYKDALADPAFTETVITHAFTGRPARALRNGFIDRHQGSAPFGYPAIHHLTRPLRQAAAQAGDPDLVNLWAGTGYRRAQVGPAADIINRLAEGL
jgi:NAD(P)H-dependent flavin oxidoreductase YrpB (nitropropane dioxygenase family)